MFKAFWCTLGHNSVCWLLCQERVVGLHVVGPNAGEITQGFTVGMRLGAKKSDFDESIGIHPTCAEVSATFRHYSL